MIFMTDAIWTEKYRPKEFFDIRGQKEIVKRVKAFVEQKNMPHLMLQETYSERNGKITFLN